ncbi:transposase [filamentous cyanobacterium LEGE 11480]|uniref:Transposase n=1 Tax=Romeriopsis navalis LEGE 11480 TaxID=2777977 RepID=A0A928VS80_9CYAN|nr:transposase [Romeriopsis navalis]MBE9033540.1 transposase [Romeriopsis navalis LEGE 11480]
MNTIREHAQQLVYRLLKLLPTDYQRDSLQTLLGLFLEAEGHPLPQSSQLKSPAALSRFLNRYAWPTRQLIRTIRRAILIQLMQYAPQGRRPWLQVIVDLTTLEKRGKFAAFGDLLHVLNGKRGVPLVVLYLVVGPFRVPWSFRVWRGQGQTTPVQLAIRLLDTLPKPLTKAFRLTILADSGFGSTPFLEALRQRHYPVIVGVRYDRKLADGRHLYDLAKPGQRVRLDGLSFPVTVAWFYLKRDGQYQQRFVLSTRRLKAAIIIWWGRRRWAIEGFFKTIKHRFGAHRFGQQTLLGMLRWLILCFTSFILTHWTHLAIAPKSPPDWAKAAHLARQQLCPELVACLLVIELARARDLLATLGLECQIQPMQI